MQPVPSKKRKRKYFQSTGGGTSGKKSKRNRLEPGVRGFIVTCSNKDEPRCVRECYNLLNEYANQRQEEEEVEEKSSQESDNTDQDNDDVETALKKERDLLMGSGPGTSPLSGPRNERFVSLDTGVNNVVFVAAPSDLDTCSVVHSILMDAKKSGTCKARYIQRLLPVEISCKAYPDDISNALLANRDLLIRHFSSTTDSPPPTYAIFFKCRNNDHLARDDVYRVVGELVTAVNPAVRVDLGQPKKAILVEVLQTVACISIVEDYMELSKYNFHLVAESGK